MSTIVTRTLNGGLLVLVLMLWPAVVPAAAQEAKAGPGPGQIPAELAIRTTVPHSGYALAFGFGSLWMISEGRLVRVNPADDSTTEIDIPTGDGAGLLIDLDRWRSIAVGEGAVWLPDVAGSVVHKVDPATDHVVTSVATDIFGSRGSIGVGEGSLWVVTFDERDRVLTRYDAASGAQQAAIPLPAAGVGVLVAEGAVWVTAASQAALYRIDPGSNQVVGTTVLHAPAHVLAAGEGAIWVPFDTEGLVQRVDTATGEVVATIATGARDMESDGDVTFGGGHVWTITRNSMVARIDPASNTVTGVFVPPTGTLMGRRIRWGAGSLWVSGSSIFRIDPPG